MSTEHANRPDIPVDVDRVLQARYLAAVVGELEAMRVPVDAATLNGPGGTVILGDQGATWDPLRPSCASWDGGRCWTLVSPAPGGGVRRHRLREHRLPAPQEVARFVARSSSAGRPALRWCPVPGPRPARGH
jgi:hypothetical protein